MEQTSQVGNVTMHYDCYSGEDLYVDGSEETLLAIVKEHPREAYNQIIQEKEDWAILYHLSDIRGNIVEWLPIEKTDNVLEIGAGCGAITGTFADKAGRVDCVDLSKARSLVNAERNKDKGNVHIYVGDFMDVEQLLPDTYDYISFIGVLEYAPCYLKEERPFEKLLLMAKKHLKKGGKMIIAIENKYGLKYWAGCKEDHLGSYYSGIEGYLETDTVKTFSKNGLHRLLASAGLGSVKFYYPYPDYKLPISIYSDDYLPKQGELNNNFRNFDAPRMLLFDETKVFDNLIADEMFDIFSNSFLVIAEQED
ncbi:MAG: class I SAM-dependent methyltransferase [Lachnospiraceae bacterium]|nr:class I SAM-dependent methyltransferase [Lachnospiraceae bacterium]